MSWNPDSPNDILIIKKDAMEEFEQRPTDEMQWVLPKLLKGHYYKIFAISDRIYFQFDSWAGDGEKPMMICKEFVMGVDYNEIKKYYNCLKGIPDMVTEVCEKEYKTETKWSKYDQWLEAKS